jgi:outer membrane protein assembly factor BamE (lipoprotein component of BamABCDE complex)
MQKKRIAIIAAAVAITAAALAGCSSQADTVSNNISQDADSFKIHRDIVVQDGITGTVLYQISGLCSLGNNDSGNQHTITCKIGSDTYVKELIWVGDQDQVLSIQSKPTPSDPFAYRIVVKPQTLDLQLQTAN